MRQWTPKDRYSIALATSKSRASISSIKRDPNPRRSGFTTAGPSISLQLNWNVASFFIFSTLHETSTWALEAARAERTGRCRAAANTVKGTPKHWIAHRPPLEALADAPNRRTLASF